MALDLGLHLGLGMGGTSGVNYADYTLALDYDDQQYWRGGTSYAALSSVPGYTFTRTGEQGAIDTDLGVDYFAANNPAANGRGYHAYAALTNYLLNAGSSGGLSTQNATTTATPYTLAFRGTGTVTLSGTSTAGPLVGTGASNQVRLNFTPTAGTLTLTVTGSVTHAVLVDGTFEIPVPIIATAGATASIGASVLSVSAAPTDQTSLFFCPAIKQDAGAGTTFIADFSDGTFNERIAIIRTGANYRCIVNDGGVAQLDLTIAAPAGGVEGCPVLLRSGGNWRFGKVVGGALTWAAAAAAGSFPTLTTVHSGCARDGSGQLGGEVKGVFVKPMSGTADADVLAAVAEAA